MKRIIKRASLLLIASTDASTALLLRDLSTPCLLIDVGFLQKQQQHASSASQPFPLPQLRTEHGTFVPEILQSTSLYTQGTEYFSNTDVFMPGVCYLHASVVVKSRDARSLVQLNVPSDSNYKAHLVLGLNNHHVISYYWARSAGAGSSMEAPGVQFVADELQWSSDDWKKCNSNDGKRSEWVAFLQPNDTVQLLPDEDWRSWQRLPVWGISTRGRPLGSEPAVVCEWNSLESQE